MADQKTNGSTTDNNVTTIQTKSNELNFNYAGVTLNVNIPAVINTIKNIKESKKKE